MKLAEITAFLFPYRTHLEREIDYLKAQLAQERRRVDILMERPDPKPVTARTMLETKPVRRPTPIGWDATRAAERLDGSWGGDEKRTEEVPARPDTGGEGSDADQRVTA